MSTGEITQRGGGDRESVCVRERGRESVRV